MHDEPWLIVDTETDGTMAPIHAVEIAAQRMRGWQRDGEPFQTLLNHEVPIDPGAEAVHGYSRAYLRKHGAPPLEAHAAFRAYAGDRPMVAYNLSFDWNRVLEPEYARLGVPVSGRRGFCALTLTRRVLGGMQNYRLETLKNHFALNNKRSHSGGNDVETVVALFERIVFPKLYQAGIHGFDAVAAFAARTPVASCLEHFHAGGDPCWYFLDANNRPCGPFTAAGLRLILGGNPWYVWSEALTDWVMSSDLVEFAAPVTPRKRAPSKKGKPANVIEVAFNSRSSTTYAVGNWQEHPATEKQLSYLVTLGADLRRIKTKRDASEEIERLTTNLPTEGQRRRLRFYGVVPTAQTTRDAAGAMIDRISAQYPSLEEHYQQWKMNGEQLFVAWCPTAHSESCSPGSSVRRTYTGGSTAIG